MNLVAPCPKKPSSTGRSYVHWLSETSRNNIDMEDVEDACLELQQILQYQQQYRLHHNEHLITRTGNPLIQDSSFIPLHQAVSQLHVSDTTTRRPRSYSVGDPRNQYIIQPLPCKPVF